MRVVRAFRSASKENYEAFCKAHPSLEEYVSFEIFKKIIYKYNELLINHLLETGDVFKFPYGLGELVINKYKPKKFKIDKDGNEKVNYAINWQESKKQGKHVYLLNLDTEGYKFYWMWSHWKSRLRCSFVWSFKVTRVNSRLLKTFLKKPNSKYKDIYRTIPRRR